MNCLNNMQPMAVSDTAGRRLRPLTLAPVSDLAHLLRRSFMRLFLRLKLTLQKKNSKNQSVALVFLIWGRAETWLRSMFLRLIIDFKDFGVILGNGQRYQHGATPAMPGFSIARLI